MRFPLISMVFVLALLVSSACRTPQPPAPAASWWKGNLHTPSLWSDGDDFPEMVIDGYKKSGYDFVALSDHNVLAEGERFVETDPEIVADYRARFGNDWVEVTEDGRVRLKTFDEYRSLFEEKG